MENERNRVNSMMLLRDHLKELFELIGIVPQKVTVRTRPKVMALLERIIKDEALYDYLEILDADCVQAIQQMQKRNLHDWNNKIIMQKQNALKAENIELKGKNQKLLQKLEAIQTTKINKESEPPKESVHNEVHEDVRKQHLTWIRETISLRDSILIRKAWIENNAPQNVDAKRLVDSQLKETGRLLEKMGVEVIEGSGKFDYQIHTVEGTIPTTKDTLVDYIAETVRPGYRYNGEMLRAQEVIIYVPDEEGA